MAFQVEDRLSKGKTPQDQEITNYQVNLDTIYQRKL